MNAPRSPRPKCKLRSRTSTRSSWGARSERSISSGNTATNCSRDVPIANDDFSRAMILRKFTRGATKEGLHLHSQTVQAIAEGYATRRANLERCVELAKITSSLAVSVGFRSSRSAIYVRSWPDQVAGQMAVVMDSYGLDSYQIRAGNVGRRRSRSVGTEMRVLPYQCKGEPSIVRRRRSGIDLGVQGLVATSAGELSVPILSPEA